MDSPRFRTSAATILLIGVVLPLAGSLLLAEYAGGWRWVNLPFHSVVEGLGSFIAVALAMLLRMRARLGERHDHRLWIACALLGMGILDGFHAAVEPGPTFIWLHSFATLVGGLLFACVWVPVDATRRLAGLHPTRWIGLAALGLAVGSIAFPDALPAMLRDDRFSTPARLLNLTGGALFLVAAARFAVDYRAQPHWESFLFAVHCTLFGSAGVLFELSQLWDAPWWWWHGLRLGAYAVAISYMAITAWEAETRAQALIVDLARSNQELEEFAFVASHDLQEPLRKVVSFSELLEQDLPGELPEAAGRDLGFIQDGARRMQKLVVSLLELSQTGALTMKRREVPVVECIAQALEALDLGIRDSHARITSDPLPTVNADPTLLTAIYQNLVSNALKFVGDEPPEIHFSSERGKAGWILGVRDAGVGIPEDRLEEVFQPFRRLHSRDAYAGAGIGLTICRRAVERHGGRIWAERPAGGGTNFRFVLG